MSVAFTNPGGASWQTLLDEITLAYSERRQVLGQSAYTPVAARKVQSAAYWAALQNWIEENCGAFVDPVNGPGQSTYKWMLATFDVESMRAAAGLNAAGFRRLPYGASSFQYGLMQENDAIGPWIFEDLQRAFSVLRWTPAAAQGILEYYTQFSACTPGESCTKAAMIQAINDNYDYGNKINYIVPDGTDSTLTPYYRSGFYVAGSDIEGWSISVSRLNFEFTFTIPYTGVKSSLALYGYASASLAPFSEADGLGLKDGKLFTIAEQAYLESKTREKISIKYTVNPADILPENTESFLYILSIGFAPHGVLKWEFTNT
jgi:hypothetical protein